MRKSLIIAGVIVVALVALNFIFHPFSSGKDHAGGDASQASGEHGGRSGGGGRKGGRVGMTGPMPVSSAQVALSDIKITRSALGSVTPLATVTVKTQIAGQLNEIAFKEGQLVQKGDLLAVIDPRPYQLALEQAQGQQARDEALLKDAKLNLARFQKLMAEDSIARQQLDTQKSLVNQYQAAIKSDQAAVDNAKLNLAYCHITAPISGRVGLRQVDQGNYVQTGDANGLVVITEVQPIATMFTLPEDDLSAVLAKVNAGAELDVEAYDRTKTTKLATGKLIALDNQIDPTTGTVKLRAQFDNQDQALFPNQFVNIVLLVDTLRDVTTVPSAAIQRGADGTFVYQIKPDKTVALHKVQIGPTDGDKVQITSDLNPGDRVVTDGADKLKDGSKISLPEEKKDGATPAPAAAADQPTGEHKESTPADTGAVPTPKPDDQTGTQNNENANQERDKSHDWRAKHNDQPQPSQAPAQ